MLNYILTFIPLLGTSIGSFLGTIDNFNKKYERQEETLVAVATGILCSITFNLFSEVLENVRNKGLFIGILVGFLFTILMNVFSHKNNLTVREKLFWAMIIHNIPEGIIVGISLVSKEILPAMILSISLQNIPDGLVVSMPLVSTKGKKKALCYGIFSGVVEPIAAILIMTTSGRWPIQKIEPFLIGFAFSAILMIVIELLKECKRKGIVLIIATVTQVFSSILG